MAHGTGTIEGHGAGPAGAAPGAHETAHPGERTYIEVAIVLAVITMIEVAVWYTSLAKPLLVSILLLLSAIKFGTVVGYFMHLKFDDRRFLWIFSGGLVVAFSIVMALYALFHWHAIAYAIKLF
jgi:cytochrome c oxidase subunit IV